MSDCESIASGPAAPLAIAKELTSWVIAVFFPLLRLHRPDAGLIWRELQRSRQDEGRDANAAS